MTAPFVAVPFVPVPFVPVPPVTQQADRRLVAVIGHFRTRPPAMSHRGSSRMRGSARGPLPFASALGTSSADTWPKMTACEEPDVVYAAAKVLRAATEEAPAP